MLDTFSETVCGCGVDAAKTRRSISAGADNFARAIDLGRNLRPIYRAYFNEKNGDLGLKLYTIYEYKNKKWDFTQSLHLILQNNMLFHIVFRHACIKDVTVC